MHRVRTPSRFLSLGRLAAFCVLFCGQPLTAADAPQQAFARTTIDLGTVVTDLEKSVRFYTEVVGFTEVTGFDVPADMATDAGLTDGKPLSIRVLVLGTGPEATKLKLMQVKGTAPRTGDTEFIHSHTGFRYLTIFVTDTEAAVARLAKHGVKPLAKSPVAIPESIAPGQFLTCLRDPDGNIVELVGPKPRK
jgi:catechol 2,3-dioxygenase-like lactoylglutathione lyase family enzyme